ncbi:phosphatidylinositol mannoside acyltransferase [Glycomyces sp. TRM65418]|uniref:phosphatidylinositol mannoside acyltransferase n=1 Tax=Glycomyces sp. TRM65418 TaxID=2867006 RepID=UPI001CE61E01|nr:phosphatidylinositol mannoside acyltransferase [Glycomyces sp. TRM65418]MCC3761695.1 phosphatidylinositol mannoside acyltransferase [Glycomyces sp. TRM65418]QZD55787.1 phosphatidylinositol mannoside acyltransferase [Glycomyces sp. TRM65418]
MSERMTELAYLAAWRGVRLLPERAAAALGNRFADRAVKQDGRAVRQLRRNLARVVDGEPGEDLIREAMRSYARYWIEAFRLPSMSTADLERKFEMNGYEPVHERARRGLGSIVALPHCGNWDFAGAWVGSVAGDQLTTVAERLKPEGVYRRFLEYRESLGMKIIPTSGSDRNPQAALGEALGAGHVVALVADRDLSRSGTDVKFFGEATTFPTGPALLAIRNRVELFTANIHYEPDRAVCHITGPVDTGTGPLRERVAVTTQRMAEAFEAGIRAHPADWHMLQRFWTADFESRDS